MGEPVGHPGEGHSWSPFLNHTLRLYMSCPDTWADTAALVSLGCEPGTGPGGRVATQQHPMQVSHCEGSAKMWGKGRDQGALRYFFSQRQQRRPLWLPTLPAAAQPKAMCSLGQRAATFLGTQLPPTHPHAKCAAENNTWG